MRQTHRTKPKSPVPKRKVTNVPGVVPHPRYGTSVVTSGSQLSEDEVKSFTWLFQGQTIFPESAIRADPTRQNFTVFPRAFYVDVLKQCRTCGRPFLFFAREQQHWFETLGFYVDADCVHCPECRRSDQQLRRRFRRYSEAVSRTDLDDAELATLVSDAVYLWQAGVLRNEQQLRRLRNLAKRRIPENKTVSVLGGIIAGLAEDRPP